MVDLKAPAWAGIFMRVFEILMQLRKDMAGEEMCADWVAERMVMAWSIQIVLLRGKRGGGHFQKLNLLER
jgi:hypothetical protein